MTPNQETLDAMADAESIRATMEARGHILGQSDKFQALFGLLEKSFQVDRCAAWNHAYIATMVIRVLFEEGMDTALEVARNYANPDPTGKVVCDRCANEFEAFCEGQAHGCDSAVSNGMLMGAYGSKHDLVAYTIAAGHQVPGYNICDGCIDALIEAGALIRPQDFLPWENPAAAKDRPQEEGEETP